MKEATSQSAVSRIATFITGRAGHSERITEEIVNGAFGSKKIEKKKPRLFSFLANVPILSDDSIRAKIVAQEKLLKTIIGNGYTNLPEVVTPTLAWEYLQKLDEDYQRRFKLAVGDEYAGLMGTEGWYFNHQGIAFDVSGRLIDGQKRLYAVIKSGEPQVMMVALNLPDTAMDGIDRIDVRTVANQLQLAGRKNADFLAAMCRSIQMIFVGKHNCSITLPIANWLLDAFGSDFDRVIAYKRKPFKSASHYGPLVLARAAHPIMADVFCRGLLRGELTQDGDPAHCLRYYYTNLPKETPSGGNNRSDGNNRAVLYAFMKHVNGKKLYKMPATRKRNGVNEEGKTKYKHIAFPNDGIDWIVSKFPEAKKAMLEMTGLAP